MMTEIGLTVSSQNPIMNNLNQAAHFSLAIGSQALEDFAKITGIEFLLIGEGTTIRDFVYYAPSQDFGRV